MADTFNEEDDVARLVGWLKHNGPALVVGVVLGLVIIGGWQWWQARVDKRANAAAELYTQLSQQFQQGHYGDKARDIVSQLKNTYADSPYATNAAMQLAAHSVEDQDYDKALGQLDWVIDNAGSKPARYLAIVRKARVLWADGQSAAAIELLQQEHPDSYDRLFAELEGDIHAANGDNDKAHAAYQRAAQADESGVAPVMLQQKLARTASGNKQTKPAATPGTDHEGA